MTGQALNTVLGVWAAVTLTWLPVPASAQTTLADAERAYLWLLDRGTPPEHIVVAGDSAGCHMVLSLLQTLREQELPLPGGAVLLCPWLDLTHETVMGEHARTYAEAYAGGVPLDDPLIAPLAADLTGFPPLLIQVATGDDRRPGLPPPGRARPRARRGRAPHAVPGRHARVPHLLVVPARSGGRVPRGRGVRARPARGVAAAAERLDEVRERTA